VKWPWLIVLYPPAWRRRYADEFLALLEQRSNSANTLLDVIASAVDAWLHPDLVATQATPVPAGALRATKQTKDKFTERSKTVLHLAEQEAIRLKHPLITADHLLLGLLLEGEGIAAHVLIDRGVQPAALREAILERLGASPLAHPNQPLGLSDEAKRTIERSVAEANRMRHHYLGTEHLLLGLCADPESPVAQLLSSHHAGDLPALRRHILRVLTEGGPHIRPPI
jgi:hypothetical protein